MAMKDEGVLGKYVVGEGTGQGLALAHSMIVGEHGGRLTFKSTVGKGSVFTIFLPSDSRTS